jgi:hypothetical protein
LYVMDIPQKIDNIKYDLSMLYILFREPQMSHCPAFEKKIIYSEIFLVRIRTPLIYEHLDGHMQVVITGTKPYITSLRKQKYCHCVRSDSYSQQIVNNM